MSRRMFPHLLALDLVAEERLRSAFLLLAMAGVVLLFVRSGAAKIAGLLLVLARLQVMPMLGTDWMFLGAIAVLGLVAAAMRRGDAEDAVIVPEVVQSEAPDRDDPSEPAPCPACRGVIPAGSSRCPRCAWTY